MFTNNISRIWWMRWSVSAVCVGLVSACSSPMANDCVSPQSAQSYALLPPEAADWHAQIDSLVATVPGDAQRQAVAWFGGDSGPELAASLESMDFNVRTIFKNTMQAVSFEGEVSLFPQLKEETLIYRLYIGNPENTGELLGCS